MLDKNNKDGTTKHVGLQTSGLSTTVRQTWDMHQQNQWVLGQKKSQNVIHGQLVGGWVQNRRHQPGGVAPHQADNALLKVFRICGSMGLQNHQAVKTNHGLSTKNWEEDHQN